MKTLTLILSLLSLPALAGTSDRGGGNALVCFDSPAIPKAIRTKGNPDYGVITKDSLKRITKIEMLDIYQAQLPRGNRPSPFDDKVGNPKPGETPEQMADRLLDRIGNYAPGVHKKILEGQLALRGNVRFSAEGVATITDANPLFSIDREKCVIATMAAQDSESDLLLVDSRLYNHSKHSVASRAAMFLHEWTYYTLLRNGVNTSAAVREIVGRMMLAGRPQSVAALINSAVKGKLIAEGRDSLNGVEIQVQEHFDRLKEKLAWHSDHAWHFDNCPENLCDTFWSFRQSYEEEMRAFSGVHCSQLDDCEARLAAFVSETTDPELRKQAERLLDMTRGRLGTMRIGESVRTFLRVDFKAELPGVYQGEPLPGGELEKAKEQFLWTLNIVLNDADRRVVQNQPLRRFSKMEDYQKAMRSLRDSLIEQASMFSTIANLKFPHLTLPHLER